MKYVVYNGIGEIVSFGEATFPDSQGLGTILEDADGTNLTHYVLNGVLTAYTAGQRTSKITPPPYSASWSNTTFSWTDSRNLVDARLQTWAAIRDARDANLAAGFTWNGYKFDSDDISIQRIMGAVQLATLALSQGQSFSIIWTLFNNSTITLSGSDLISVYIALGTFTQACFTAGVALRQQIDVATENPQLDALSWTTIS